MKAIPEVAAHKHIVLCGDNLNALSIIRSLGQVGIRPIVIVLQGNPIPPLLRFLQTLKDLLHNIINMQDNI